MAEPCKTNRLANEISSAWLVEVLMLLLGFNVISIRAKHKQKEREDAVRLFNDANYPVQVLVTSVRISPTAIDLQKDCSDVIFLDVPSNAQSTQQAGGRVIRIGQTSACSMYILTTDHSYDQVLQAAAAKKMISIIAGYTSKKPTPEEIEKFKESHPSTADDDDSAPLRFCDYTTNLGKRGAVVNHLKTHKLDGEPVVVAKTSSDIDGIAFGRTNR